MGNFTSLLRSTGLAVTLAMPAYAQDADTVVATVNGTEITLGHVITLRERLPEQYQQLPDTQLFEGIVEQLVRQTALAQQIEDKLNKEAQLGLENERNAFLASEFVASVGTTSISAEAIKERYDLQFASVEPSEEYNASHILVDDEELAKDLIKQLVDGADFATLAKENSTGPSGPRGGELGWFGKGQMVPAFEGAVLELENGEVAAAPVETQFGFHVIKRNDSRNQAAPALEEVRADIEELLKSEAIQKAIEEATESAEIIRTEVEIDPSLIRNVELLSD